MQQKESYATKKVLPRYGFAKGASTVWFHLKSTLTGRCDIYMTSVLARGTKLNTR